MIPFLADKEKKVMTFHLRVLRFIIILLFPLFYRIENGESINRGKFFPKYWNNPKQLQIQIHKIAIKQFD